MNLRGFEFGGQYRFLQHVFELLQTLLTKLVSISQCRVDVHQQRQLARQVVNHRQLFGLQQQDIGATQAVGRATVYQFLFNMAHRVVAKVTGQTAAKTRHARTQCHFETRLVTGNEVQGIAVIGFHHHAIGHHLGVGRLSKTIGTQQGASW